MGTFSSVANIILTDSYVSCTTSGPGQGAVFGKVIAASNNCDFSNVYYDTDANPFRWNGTGSCSSGTSPTSLSCATVYNSVVANFSNNTWNGDNLVSGMQKKRYFHFDLSFS